MSQCYKQQKQQRQPRKQEKPSELFAAATVFFRFFLKFSFTLLNFVCIDITCVESELIGLGDRVGLQTKDSIRNDFFAGLVVVGACGDMDMYMHKVLGIPSSYVV